MLPIAEKIRTKRREKNITQDELAQALGVTFQSVSRWETEAAYPDIELIPKIAAYFEMSTDELLGADEETKKLEAQKKKREYIDILYHTPEISLEQKYKTAMKAYSEFNNEFPFAITALEILVYNNIKPREEALPIVRDLCADVLDRCHKAAERSMILKMIYIYEDEDKLSDWYKYASSWLTIDELYELRYDALNDVDKCNLQRQINLYDGLNKVFDYAFGRRHKTKYKDSDASIVGQSKILEIIDLLRDPTEDIDGWIGRRAFTYLRLSAAYFGSGKHPKGYEALDKAIELYEKILSLPPNTELGFNSPIFDTLKVKRKDDFGVPDRTQDFTYDYTEMTFENIYYPLTRSGGWEWFDCVRGEERFKSYIERIIKFKPAGFKE